MKRPFRFGLTALIGIFCGTSLFAQTNSYVSTHVGFWQDSTLWSLGQPPSVSQSGILITNSANTTVSIDNIAATAFQDTLTISNLTVYPPQTNNFTVFLDNTGSIAVHILDGLDLGLNPNQSFQPGGGATLINGNSTLIVDGVSGGRLNDDGTMIIAGGSLIVTNCTLILGASNVAGTLTITNGGLVEARDVMDGYDADGNIQIIGSTMILSSSLTLGGGYEASGGLLVTDGGLLVVTNGPTWVANGDFCSGSVTVSNAVILADDMNVGFAYGGGGGLTIEDGTVTLNGSLSLGGYATSGGASLSGGVLTVTNGATAVGTEQGFGELAINEGLFLTRSLLIGANGNASGKASINGGVTEVISNLQVGDYSQSEASVFLYNGQLLVPNGEITVGAAFCCDTALIDVRGGLLAANYIDLGLGNPDFGGGILSVEGGSVTVSTGITLGDCALGNFGFVTVSGGQTLVTNATSTGFIDVQDGELTLDDGTLQVDKLVMTNACGQFIHSGGTLIVGSVILDPNAFRIVSVTRQSNDALITWLMAPGATNALQASGGSIDGSYTTNNFTDIFIVTNNTSAGVLTNYLDAGAATNKSRYYRARLSP